MTANGSESKSERRIERSSMQFSNLKKGMVAAIAVVLTIPLMTAKAIAGSSLRVQATIADNAITALEDTCDPTTGLPKLGDGACVGIETISGAISGNIAASYLAEINFTVLASGEAPVTSFTQFTGTVAGHGSGSFTILEVDSISPSGEITGQWRVVEGSANGDLVGMSGGGKIVGTYDSATGLGSGLFSGVLQFSK